MSDENDEEIPEEISDNESSNNEYFSKDTPKWVKRLGVVIEKYWKHHGPCQSLNFHIEYSEEYKTWNFSVAPVFQEVFGGEDDGKKVWTGFLFEAGKFTRATSIEVQDWAIASACEHCSPYPKLMMKAKYRGHRVLIQIVMEPPTDTDAIEVVDVVSHEIRRKE